VSVHADNQGGTSQIEWLRQLKFPQSSQEIPLLVSLGAAILKNEYLFQVKRFDDQEVAIIQIAHPSHEFFKNGWGTHQSFFIEGWMHIVSGYDHIVFIVTLLAASVILRRWFWVLTSFTVAHGVTYSFAAYGVLHVRSEWIEPVIALTILVTAALSLFKVKAKPSAEIAAVFGLGLFHGLGFAIAMSAQLNNARFPIASVIGFNLGIEMGQLAICLILGAVFWFLRRYPSLFDNLRSLMIWSGFIAGGF